MHKLIITITIFSIFCSCSQEGSKSRIEQRIDRIENGLIEFGFNSAANLFQPDSVQRANTKTFAERIEHYKTPGVSVAVVNKNKVEWSKAYGIMDKNTGKPVTTETIFEAGSISKLITSVMALHFVQEGLLELDTDVNNYLKSWQVPENEFTCEDKVTLRRLLTHQAGLPATNYPHDDNMGYPTLIDVLNGEPPALNKPATPEFVPGMKWQYSNIGYNVIQLLLEDVSGKSFQEIAEEIVFKPLGMKNSTFVYPLDAERRKREAMPHDAEGISRKPGMHLTALAQGGLTTTPIDLAIFTNELMFSYQGKSEVMISQEMTKRLFTKECEIDQNMFPLPFSEGLGVFLMGEGRDFLFTHPGSNGPGSLGFLVGWPERGTGAVVMANGPGMVDGFLILMEIVSAINIEYNK